MNLPGWILAETGIVGGIGVAAYGIRVAQVAITEARWAVRDAREAVRDHLVKGGLKLEVTATKPDERLTRAQQAAAQKPGATTTTVPPVVAPVPSKTGQDAA